MSKFEEFKEAFEAKFEGTYGSNKIYDFMEIYEENGELPFGGKLSLDNDNIAYDSYGSEDSRLERVFFFEEFGIHVQFNGRRQSYSGEDWDGYKEVKPVEKTITIYE